MPATYPMQPQAALYAAVIDALRTKLGYSTATCGRGHLGQPPPRAGSVYAAVWGDGRRGNGDRRPNLDMVFGVNVTVTVRAEQPFDRWDRHEDELEARLNAVAAYVNADATDYRIANAANVLAGFRRSGDTSRASAAPVGFCEGLAFEGFDPVREAGPDWFHADAQNPQAAERNLGFAQTARFGRARRVQAALTAG